MSAKSPSEGPTVLCLFKVSDPLRELLDREVGALVTLRYPETAEPEELLRMAGEGADVFMGWRPTPELLEAAGPRLRVLINPGAGVRHLREPLAARPDLVVINGHGNADNTAESTVALLLAVMKRIPQHDAWMRAGRWRTGDPDAKSWRLRGRTVGLLGLGSIGQRVGHLLSPFGVRFVGLRSRPDRAPTLDRAARLHMPAQLPLERIYGPDELGAFLDAVSVLIISVPQTEETEGLIGAEQLARLGPDAVLVNVGRGPVVCEQALYEALRGGAILGAAIDVWYNYKPEGDGGEIEEGKRFPYAPEHPFHELDNVVLSPHRAASPFDDLSRWDEVLENLRRLADGREDLLNRVDLARGY